MPRQGQVEQHGSADRERKRIELTWATACIIFHNWMVTHRMDTDEREEVDHYTPAFQDPANAERRDEDEIVQMLTERADVNREAALGQLIYHGGASDHAAVAQAQMDNELPLEYQMCHRRWQHLTDKQGFKALREAIINVVAQG
jgi:hypothetical protein